MQGLARDAPVRIGLQLLNARRSVAAQQLAVCIFGGAVSLNRRVRHAALTTQHYLGRRQLPRDLSVIELEAFFTFGGAERQAIAARRAAASKLGLALQIGCLRTSG